jgi:hypothetical protein
MLISPGMHADENDKIEVLDASDSRKLNSILRRKTGNSVVHGFGATRR